MIKRVLAIAPVDLPAYWPQIREEVAELETPDGFIPEDVYGMCRQNHATLFFLFVNEERIGWAVLRKIENDLHIWQLKAKIGYEVMQVFRDELMGIARNARATKITYGSNRAAWSKVSKDHGFKVRMVVYECPVEPELAPPPAPPINN